MVCVRVAFLLSSVVQGADANATNKGGNIALHYHKGRDDIVEALVPHTKNIDATVAKAAHYRLSWVADALRACRTSAEPRHCFERRRKGSAMLCAHCLQQGQM